MLSSRIPVGHLRESWSKEAEDVGGMKRPSEGGVCRNRGRVAGNEVEGQGTEKSKNRLPNSRNAGCASLAVVSSQLGVVLESWMEEAGEGLEMMGQKFAVFLSLNQEEKDLGIMKEEKKSTIRHG